VKDGGERACNQRMGSTSNVLITSNCGRIHDTFWMELDVIVNFSRCRYDNMVSLYRTISERETNCRSSKNWSTCGGESPTIWGVETSDVLVKKDNEICAEFV